MQSSSDLDSQVKILFTKSNEAKPYGFTLISETDDGTPAFYVGKTEVAARNQAKEELKTAKKKKMVIGLAFIKDKKLVLKPGSKPIHSALVNKAFKKFKDKTKKYKGVFSKNPEILDGEVSDDSVDLESASGKTSKYMSIFQNRQAQYQDLEGLYLDAQQSFFKILELIPEKNTTITEIESNLKTVFKNIEAVKPLLHEAEKLILSEADKTEIKTKLKDLKQILSTHTQTIEDLTSKIQGLSLDGTSNEDDLLEVGSIAWILKQAENLQTKMKEARAASQDTILEAELKRMTKFIEKMAILSEQEKSSTGISTKEEDRQEKNLQELNQQFIQAMVNAKIQDTSILLGKRAQSISTAAYSKAEMGILQFQSAVLSHPTILNDFRFPAIQKQIFALNLSDLPKANFSSITSSKELANAVEKYKKENKKVLKKWKNVEKTSPFGKCSIYTHISDAFKQILKMKE